MALKNNIIIFSLLSHFNSSGGITTHLNQFSRLLIEAGHDVVVICPSGTDDARNFDQILHHGVKYICIPGISSFDISRQWIDASLIAFKQESLEKKIDVVFSEGYSIIGALSNLKRMNIPSFCILHNFGITHFYNVLKEVNDFRSLFYYIFLSIPRIILRILKYELSVFRTCSKVLSVSQHNAKRISKFYKIKRDNISILSNWVDTSKFMPSMKLRAAGQRKWNISPERINFLIAGSLYYPKGFHIAIKAFSAYIGEYRQAVLWVAGSGNESNSRFLINTASNHGLMVGKDIVFLGAVPRANLLMLYNSADVFIMPSLLIEGSAFVLLEAMACALPCICTNIGGNAEAIGDAGLQYAPKDHSTLTKLMVELSTDPALRSHYGNKARQRIIDHYSEQKASENVKSLLMRI